MAPSPPRLRILSVGGNAVSAFLSWRLQATNACDVTLVWKANYQAVAQYGITFKSQSFGNERFKPRHVVTSPEEASSREAAFDYVLLCVKALPDVYDLADIVQSVVTPQHTCILVNTTNTLGVEQQLEARFPTNVVLSLVSGADLVQHGPAEFEHTGSTDIWVGPANVASSIPSAIQKDMSAALAMTLTTGQVNCRVSDNIRQQQYERMIGPIAFHPTSVIFETPSHAELLEKPGVREIVSEVIDELLQIAASHHCTFPSDFKEKTLRTMLQPTSNPSTMYQDFTSRRPMEVETYLGSPLTLAAAAGVRVPRIQTLYAVLHNINVVNKDRPLSVSPAITQPPSRADSLPPQMQNQAPRNMNGGLMPGPMNGYGRGIRGPMGPGPRRGPPPVNGYRGPPNSYPLGPGQLQRRPSEETFDEFQHVVLYDDIPEGEVAQNHPQHGMDVREREFVLREREIRLRQQEMQMRRGPPGPPPAGRRGSHVRRAQPDFDDDDDDEYVDPMDMRGPPMPQIDPDNFDMMSVTSRRTRRAPSASQLRKDGSEFGGPGSNGMRPGSYGRPGMGRNRSSGRFMPDMPSLHDDIMNNPMMGFASNRYGNVDRKEMHEESRTNSLTAARIQEMGPGGGAYPGPPPRRMSQSPGNPLGPPGPPRGMGRPSPPNGSHVQPGQRANGRPSPPGMQAPTPRYPPGHGNAVHPQQVEQQIGVSKPFPPPKAPAKSLTGSASASAGSGDSGSANVESEPSAHSSTSSFAPRYALGVR